MNKEQINQNYEVNFKETIPTYTVDEAKAEATRCYNCKHFPCQQNCPAGVRIPEFIMQVKEGNIKAAYDIISSTSNLPSMCGRACPHENQCQGVCTRCKVDGTVNIGRLERFVADTILQEQEQKGFADIKNEVTERTQSTKASTVKNPKVAIIGSGPSGLSSANELAKYGIQSTVFERDNQLGGVLRLGIPSFRIPVDVVERQIALLKNLGVDFQPSTEIISTQNPQASTLSQETGDDKRNTKFIADIQKEYDYIILGQGVTDAIKLGIPNEDAKGIYSAYNYLKRAKLLQDKTSLVAQNVVVVGGGNVAMDSSCTAKKLGSQNVTILYRRTRKEMPAREIEIEEALSYGSTLQELTNPKKFVVDTNGKLTGIECAKMELGEPDSSGRRSPIEVVGSNFIVPADIVILSLGSRQDKGLLADLGLELQNGRIPVDTHTMATKVPNIYACGDVMSGALTVVTAMVAGKTAAQSILTQLGITPTIIPPRELPNEKMKIKTTFQSHIPKENQ